jgi:parallel beta-helix repeat protein
MSRKSSYLWFWNVRSLWPLALSLALSFAAAGLAIGQTYTIIDYPGATATSATGINNGGDILGYYQVPGVASRGFLLSAGKFTQIDYPDAKSTNPRGISAQGDIVGTYSDTGGTQHGFLLSKGKFSTLDYPGAGVQPQAINSAGDIVGMIQFPGKPMQGFLLKGGTWTMNDYLLDVPSTTMNCYLGINDAGVMVGHWTTRAAGSHGVVYTKGTAAQFDYGAGGDTEAYGINSTGDIVGYYLDVSQAPHGFVRRNGRSTPIDYPGSPHTMAYGINDSGQIAGHFQDAKKVFHGFVVQLPPAESAPPVLTVDDDGVDCPGALPTIQEAVAKAPAGSTILVCPGVYRGTVNIVGPEKTALKLIAVGRADEVVLQGDYTQRDGFYLENVTNVVIRGFTVRDFGNQATTAAQWGAGAQVRLLNAHYNTIEQNRVINGDMMGIILADSGNNIIQHNVAWVNNSALATCGIHLQGAKSANNLLLLNFTYGNNVAGIMLSGAGSGNQVLDNITIANGRDGITNTGTNDTWIEGNRTSYNRGPWGTTPDPAETKGVGRGITIETSTGVTVSDNRARGNSGTDINWDGNGDVKFDSNACDTSTPVGSCANSVPNPASTAGAEPANAPGGNKTVESQQPGRSSPADLGRR